MAIDITNELNNIKSATYGEQVRGSIHDGIKKIAQEVDTTVAEIDSSNPVIVRKAIAPYYDSNDTSVIYNIGDYVYHIDDPPTDAPSLYRCQTPTTGGVDFPGSPPNWVKATLANDINRSEINQYRFDSVSGPGILAGKSCDDLTRPGVWYVNKVDNVSTLTDFPIDGPGWIRISGPNNNRLMQEVYPSDIETYSYRLFRTKDLRIVDGTSVTTWTDWYKIPIIPEDSHWGDSSMSVIGTVLNFDSDAVMDIALQIAEPFTDNVPYVAGDLVVKDNVLYKFTANHVAGAWTGNDAVSTSVADEVTDLKADLDEYEQIFTADVDESVSNWLNEHPEVTTTINFEVVNKVFDTISDMKSDATLKNGDNVKTNGYYTKNDGGHGFYYIRVANENEVCDDGSTHLLNNGLVAVLMPYNKNVLNFKQWGAKADGETDCSTVYGKCIDYIKDNFPVTYSSGDRGEGGAIIYIPVGTYYFANTCEARHYVTILGENRYTSILTCDADKLFYANRDNYTSESEIIGRQWNFNLKNLTFANCQTVLNHVQSINTEIENCSFLGCTEQALVLYLTVNVRIKNCIFYGCKEGILFGSVGVGPSTTTLVSNCWFAHCTSYGIRANFGISNGIQPLTIENSIFEYNASPINASGSATYPTTLNINNCYFEGNTSAGNISNCSVNANAENLFESTDKGINVNINTYTIIDIENSHSVGFALSTYTKGKIKFKLANGRIFDTWERKVIIPSTKGLGFASFIPDGSYTAIAVYKSNSGYYIGAIAMTVSNGSSTASKLADIAGNLTAAVNNSRIDITDASATNYALSIYY